MEILIAIIVLVAIIFVFNLLVKRVTIFEYEVGLKYIKGKFKTQLEPGQYWFLPFFTTIQKFDVRPRFVSITGQEVLSNDGVTIKISLAANYSIKDPYTAINKVFNFQEAVYLELQLALREIIGQSDVETVLRSKKDISSKLKELAIPQIEAMGVELISVNLKDIMFPGKLKEIFAKVVNAKQEGLAALEKSRGETAALRNLANAAKMIEGNPHLMQLRLFQVLGESSGNTIVLGLQDHQLMPHIKNALNTMQK